MSSVTASASAVEFAATAARPPAAQNTPGDAARSAGAAASTGAVAKAGSAQEAQRAQAGQEPDRATLLQAVDEVRNAIKPVAQDLLFSIDDDSGRTVVKVVDSSTDEVIRQIPSKELLAISKALDKLQGLLLKQEA